MRTLLTVIDKIQAVVPSTQTYLHRTLAEIRARVLLSPQELHVMRWQELADAIGAAIGLPEPLKAP